MKLAVIVVVAVLVAAFVFAVVVVIVVAPAATVTVVIAVPMMVMLEVAARTIPIAGVEAFAVMAGADPAGAFIRRTSPVAAVPNVVAANRVPIALDPCVFGFGTGADRTHSVNARWRGRSDLNTDGNLTECRWRSDKNGAGEQ